MPNSPPKEHSTILWQQALKKEVDEQGLNAFVQVLSDMRDAQQDTNTRLGEMSKREAERDIKLDELFEAFPAKDAAAHRRYHDLIIAKIEETRKLRVAITEKTVSGLLWSLIVFIGMCIWSFLLHKVGTGK